MNLLSFIKNHPIVPYIRESDMAVRTSYYYPARKLLDYHLIYVHKGRLQITADGETFMLQEGQFCLMQPGTVHDLRTFINHEAPYAHLDFFYRPDREEGIPTKPGQVEIQHVQHLMQPRLNDFDGIDVPIVLEPKEPALYQQLMLEMVESWLDPNPLSKLQAQAAATKLFHLIVKDHTMSKKSLDEQEHSLEWIPSYCSLHLSEAISIEQLAKRANLSPSRFRAVFRERFGAPPHQYLLNLRLDHAKELLTSTNYTVAQIAAYCGFLDASHFANRFRRREGITPRELREGPASKDKYKGVFSGQTFSL